MFQFGTSKAVTKLSKIYPKDMEAPPGGVDDMTKLSYLHEPGVLQNLKTRYELNEIYVSFLPFILVNLIKFIVLRDYSYFFYHGLCNNMYLSYIVADIYWKYSNCHKSIPKTASSL